MKIAELVAEIVIKGGKESVATMKALVTSSIGAKVSLIGAAAAMSKMSEVARSSAMFMDMYQLNTGLSIVQLQKLSFQAGQAGVSMQELGDAIQTLQQANANARLGYGWDPIFTRLGIHPGQDPVTQLNKIGSVLRSMQVTNPAEAHALAIRAGLSNSMYYALMRGTTEQMDKQLVITEKEQKALVKLNQQWNKFWFYIKQIGIKFQALTSNFQTGFVKVITRAALGFYNLCDRIFKAIRLSDDLKVAVVALGVALASVFAPEMLVLGAIILALEDIYTYFEGGDSLTGRIIEWIKSSEEFKDTWEDIKDLFIFTVEAVKLAFKGIKDLLTLMNELGVFEYLARIITELVDGISWILTIPFIRNLLEDAGAGKMVNAAQRRLDKRFGDTESFVTPEMRERLFTQKGIYISPTTNLAYNIYGDNPKQIVDEIAHYDKQLIATQGQSITRAIGEADGGYNYGNSKLAYD